MKKIWFVLAVAVMVSATVGTDAKASFVGLVNTGSGGVHNGADANWTVTAAPGLMSPVAATIVKSGGVIDSGVWLADSLDSSWIKLNRELNPLAYGIDPTGIYEFETSFTANGNSLLSGQFLADNQLLKIELNGLQVFGLGPVSEFKVWTDFVFNVNAGANTLKFFVDNYSGGGQNPVGLRVEFDQSGVIPEPAAVVSWLVGSLCAVGMIGYRRRSSGVLASSPV